MGHGTTVFMIDLVNKSPYKEQIEIKSKEFRKSLKAGDHDHAAEVGVDLAELIVEHVKYSDTETNTGTYTETEKDQEEMIELALKACKHAYSILSARENHDVNLLRSCLLSHIRVLSRIECYDEAIDILDEFIPLLNDEQDDFYLREVYHDVAGLYFCRGHSENAKFDDYDNALRFYKLERRKIDTVVPEDTEILTDWERSSNLNMGILEAKEMGSFESAIRHLKEAYNMAHTLRKHEEKRVTVWEIGNAYRNHGNLEQLVKAQQQELNIIQRYKFKDKEALCLEEMLLTQLELGNYDKCRELYDKLQVILEDSEESFDVLDKLSDAIHIIQSRRLAIAHQPEVALLGPVYNRSVLYLELGEAEYKTRMFRAALESAENGIKEIEKDQKLKEQLAGLLIDLMQLKANALWMIRQSTIEEFESLNEEILGNIRLYCQNMEQRLKNLREVYERMANLFYYFEDPVKHKAWEDVLEKCEIKLETLGITNEDTHLGVDDEVLNEGIALMDLSEVKGPVMDLSKVEGAMDPILTVRVALLINKAEKIVFVDVYNDTKCIDWLMEQVMQKAWESYGYEPIVYALQTEESGMLNPQDLIIETISGNFERVDALYKGFREKTPLELYLNACSRKHVLPNHSVELALENQAPGELLLSDACLVSDDVVVVCDLLRHMKPVTKLDLSGNVLYDHDIVNILRYVKDLHHLDLSSNRITLTTLLQLQYPNLQSLALSFNPLGCHVLPMLPTLLSKCPRLESLDIESCDVTYTPVTDKIHDQFQHNEHRLNHINVTFNELGDEGLREWKPLLENMLHVSEQLKL